MAAKGYFELGALQLGFTKAVHTCMVLKYSEFQERASRSEYWYFALFYYAGWLVLGVAPYYGAIASGSFASIFPGWAAVMPLLVFIVVCMLPSAAVCVRRLHDLDASGWWYPLAILLLFVPLINYLAIPAWWGICCLKGTSGTNRFGPDPLAPETSADVFS